MTENQSAPPAALQEAQDAAQAWEAPALRPYTRRLGHPRRMAASDRYEYGLVMVRRGDEHPDRATDEVRKLGEAPTAREAAALALQELWAHDNAQIVAEAA